MRWSWPTRCRRGSRSMNWPIGPGSRHRNHCFMKSAGSFRPNGMTRTLAASLDHCPPGGVYRLRSARWPYLGGHWRRAFQAAAGSHSPGSGSTSISGSGNGSRPGCLSASAAAVTRSRPVRSSTRTTGEPSMDPALATGTRSPARTSSLERRRSGMIVRIAEHGGWCCCQASSRTKQAPCSSCLMRQVPDMPTMSPVPVPVTMLPNHVSKLDSRPPC